MAYKTPGVFVEEITTLAPSVVPAETAIPAFIGYTETASDGARNNLRFVPTRITSLLEYQKNFGGDFVPATYEVVLDTAANDAVGAVSPRDAAGNERRYRLFNAVRHYYANGGGPCYIVSVGSYDDAPALGTSTTGLLGGLASVAPVDDPTLLVFPDSVSLSAAQMGSLQAAALAQCELLQDRFVIMDLCHGDQPISLSLNPIKDFRDNVGTNSLKYGAAYYPWVRTIYEPDVHFRQLSVKPAAQSVSSITLSTTTATVTTATAHGFTTGRSVTIAGANQAEYNGTFTIAVTAATAFTYTVIGTPATPATGTITAQATIDSLTGDTTLDALPGAVRAADAIVGTVVSAVNVGAMTAPGAITLTRANFTQLSDHFAGLVDRLRQLPAAAPDADVQQRFSNLLVLPRALALGLRALDTQSVSSITLSTTTATVTTASAHGLTTGQSVTIAGADQAEYNGTFTITVTAASTFTYTVTGTPATPATGTITAQAAQSVSSITRSAGTATVTTASVHGFTTGQSVTIAGADQTEYNGTFTIAVTGASTFTYTVTGTPATPATGTITAQAAQSVSSITLSTSTATVTTTSAHGFTTGQSVTIAGANQAEYNGTFTIAVTGASTFTYTVTGTPGTPATGTITAQALPLPLPPTLSLAVTNLRQDAHLRASILGLIAYEKNAGVMNAVAATRAVADVAADYASLNGSDWILPNANVGAIAVSTETFTGANLRATALNAATELRRFFDPLAAAVLSLFSAAEFLASEAEKQLFARHPVFGDIVSQVTRTMVLVPPSGAVAGVYAAVDRTRGVWKAPANVSLADISGVAVKVNDQMQEDLNVTSTGKSVNAIRAFAGKGSLIWGARTLAGNDNEWRYVPVRRFFNMAEESIKKASEPFVFEPNDRGTWVRVRAMIENFLTVQWRQGALAGAVTQQAFFVKVGLGETMTAQDILEGRMIVEVGLAVVRPAEFIILRFAHKMQTS